VHHKIFNGNSTEKDYKHISITSLKIESVILIVNSGVNVVDMKYYPLDNQHVNAIIVANFFFSFIHIYHIYQWDIFVNR
jgi:hypothetical protein